MAATSGFNAFAQYGFESTFKTASTETNYKPFAFGMTVTRDANNNPTYIYGIGDKDAVANTPGVFAGTGNITGFLADPWWLGMFFGAPTDAGAGPYTHTYTDANEPVSFTTDINLELGATDSQIQLLGCVAQNIELSASVGDPIGFNLNFAYADEAESGTLTSNASMSYERPFFFQEGVANIGGNLVQVQNFTLTIEQNPIMVNALGTRESQAFTFGQRSYSFSFEKSYLDDDELEAFYGGATPAASPADDYLGPVQNSMTLTFNNGDASTAQRQLVITLANCFFDTHATNYASDAVVNETITGQALSLTSAVATDNTSAPPA
jgi:hypothetical protein